MFERFEIVEQSKTEIKLKEKTTGELHRRFKAFCSICKKDRGWQKKFKQFRPCKSCALHQEFLKTFDCSAHTNIDIKDSILYKKKNGGSETRYRVKCPTCSRDRGYITLANINKECRSCVRKTMHRGFSIQQKEQFAQKISMTQTGETIFSGFKTSKMDKQRNLFKSSGLSKQCFERDNYTCNMCGIHGVEFNAHHMNGFDIFPNERFNLDNLITLCKKCHDAFHSVFGRGSNTKEQFLLFKSQNEV